MEARRVDLDLQWVVALDARQPNPKIAWVASITIAWLDKQGAAAQHKAAIAKPRVRVRRSTSLTEQSYDCSERAELRKRLAGILLNELGGGDVGRFVMVSITSNALPY